MLTGARRIPRRVANIKKAEDNRPSEIVRWSPGTRSGLAPVLLPMRNAILTMQSSGIKAAAIVQDMLTLARRGVPKQTVLNLNRVKKGRADHGEPIA